MLSTVLVCDILSTCISRPMLALLTLKAVFFDEYVWYVCVKFFHPKVYFHVSEFFLKIH